MPAIDFKIGRWTNFKIDQSLQRPGKMKLMIKLLDAFVPLGEVFCYKYEDLDQDHIRLLRVLPGKGTETLCCQMVQEPLKNPPKFNTLSYTWGNSFNDNNRLDVVSTVKIFLNGRPHRITLNLLSALRFYRENYTDLLWVDYLSINQSNFIERGQQVLIMRNIYEQSSMVFIWLGDEADDSTLAIEFLESVSEEPTITASAAYIVRTIQSRNFLKEWKALDHFWKRPWWMRTWIIQEQAVAGRIEAACGSRRLDWNILSRFTDAVTTAISSGQMDACMDTVRRDGIRLNTKILHHLQTLKRLRKETVQGKRLHLLSVLDSTRRALASDNRDKIYGILSFVKDQSILVPKPDYNCTVQEVYSSLVLAYIDHYKNLDILVQASTNKKFPHLPTWTPDWSEEKRISRLNRRHSHIGFFHAAGNTAAAIIPSSDDKILICEGICVDALDGVGHCLLEKSDLSRHSQPENIKTIYGNEEATFAAIWRSLLSDVRYFANSSFERAPDVMGHLFIKKCRNWENVFADQDHPDYNPDKEIHPDISIFEVWYSKSRLFSISGRPIKDWALERLEAAQVDERNVILNASFERTMKKKVLGRKMITTETGYIGLAPLAAQRGDKMCILFGCSTPVVLRPLPGKGYEFIGECYVHGIMEGEAMEMFETQKLVKEEFALH